MTLLWADYPLTFLADATMAIILMFMAYRFIVKRDRYRIVGYGLFILALTVVIKALFVQFSMYTTAYWAITEVIDVVGVMLITIGIAFKD